MKNYFRILIALITSLTIQLTCYTVGWAQAPMGIPYQAVARDSNHAILANQTLAIRFSIRNLSDTGVIQYQETHSTTTNSLGLFSLNIGEGVPVVGSLAGLDWNNGNKFLEVELDINGGTAYTSMGRTQLMTVPYAFNAATSSDNKWSQTGNDISNTNSGNLVLNGNVNIGTGAMENYKLITQGNNFGIKINGTGGFYSGGQLNYGDANFVYIKEDEDDKLQINAERIAFTNSPNSSNSSYVKVGIGTTQPLGALHVFSTDELGIRVDVPANKSAISVGGTGEINVDAVNVMGGRFCIKNNGFVGINNNNPLANFHLKGGFALFDHNSQASPPYGVHAGALCITGNRSGGFGESVFFNVSPAGSNTGFSFRRKVSLTSSVELVRIDADGTVHMGAWLLWSDRRLKKNITPLSNELSKKILDIKTYSYNYNNEVMQAQEIASDDKKHYGVLAQELETLFPELVHTSEGGLKSVNYSELIPLMINSIQDLIRTNEALHLNLENQQKQINELKSSITK